MVRAGREGMVGSGVVDGMGMLRRCMHGMISRNSDSV